MDNRAAFFTLIIIFLVIIAPVSADSFNLLDKFPIKTNGENNVYLQYLTGGTYVNLKNVGPYIFSNPKGPDVPPAQPPFITTRMPGSERQYIWTKPGSLLPDQPVTSIIRVTIPDEGGQVQVKGFAGYASNGMHFSIYKGEAQYANPVWSTDKDDAFDITIPYKKNDQIFFSVRENYISPDHVGYWKDLTLMTSDISGSTSNPALAGQSGNTSSFTKNLTNLSPSLSTDGKNPEEEFKNLLPLALGALLLIGAGGVWFVQKRKKIADGSEKGGVYIQRPQSPTDPALEPGTPRPQQDMQKRSLPARVTPKMVTPKELPSEISDRYVTWEFLGKGGFAQVFKAKRRDGVEVAVKIPLTLDGATGKSFIAELKNWTEFDHPNIVHVYDYNILPVPYFEMELCDGSLAEVTKPMESEEAAWFIFNVCEGLKYTHSKKVIHRDLKPQNILLKGGIPKISDWGLSRILTESVSTTATSFTPYYAAPEQMTNKPRNERTDIWQLGVILYELVTGVLPFQGDSMIEIGMNITTKDPRPPGEIKPDAKVIDAVVMKCLQKDPAKRYQSVLELQKDLAMYLRKNYTELLKTSVSVQDYTRSASYCGDLVMINMHTGDIPTAYKFLLDLVHYSKGDVKAEAQELSEQIKMRMEEGVTEIPDELIQKAEIIVHKVSIGFRKMG